LTDNDSSSVYELGKQYGYEECKNEIKEIIESMAYEIASYRYPRRYEYYDDQIQSIISEFGFEE